MRGASGGDERRERAGANAYHCTLASADHRACAYVGVYMAMDAVTRSVDGPVGGGTRGIPAAWVRNARSPSPNTMTWS